MSTFLFSYRVPRQPLQEQLAELDDAAREARLAAWIAWFDDIGAALVDRGHPVADVQTIGECGPTTRAGGYSLVSADDLESAIALAKRCPGLEWGGGVEVGAVFEMGALTSPAASDALAATT